MDVIYASTCVLGPRLFNKAEVDGKFLGPVSF
jgi:hypothetical protein